MNTLNDFYANVRSPIGGNILQCKCTASAANVMGIATTAIKEYLTSFFPPNFFSTIHVETETGTSNIEDYDNNINRSTPALVISPKMVFTDDTNFQYVPDWTSIAKYTYGRKDVMYNTVFKDDNEKIYLYSVPDRIHIDYDITIVSKTKASQINTAYYLKQSMHQKGFDKIKPLMEAEIPKYLIYAIGKALGINVSVDNKEEQDEGINKIVEYLNNKSSYKIQRKINLATGNPFYTMITLSNFIIENPEYPDMDDGEETGQTKSKFRTNFQLRVEFWSPMTYILETGKKINPSEVIVPEGIIDNDDMESINFYHTVKFAPAVDLYDKKLFLWESFVTDNLYQNVINEDNKTDFLDFSPLLSKKLKAVLASQYELKDVKTKKVRGKVTIENNSVFFDEEMSSSLVDDGAVWYNLLTDGNKESLTDDFKLVLEKGRIKISNLFNLEKDKPYHIVFFDENGDIVDRFVFNAHRMLELNDKGHRRLYQYVVMKDEEILDESLFDLDMSNYTIYIKNPYINATYHFAFYLNFTMIKALEEEYDADIKKAKKTK